jgi:hypothetical protein
MPKHHLRVFLFYLDIAFAQKESGKFHSSPKYRDWGTETEWTQMVDQCGGTAWLREIRSIS